MEGVALLVVDVIGADRFAAKMSALRNGTGSADTQQPYIYSDRET